MTDSVTDFACGVLVKVAYDGTAYHGFAPQIGVETVADRLARAIGVLDSDTSSLRYTSRTDAGVHACGQLVAFDTHRIINPRGWVLALAHHLCDDISPKSAAIVPVGFDPRHHVCFKWYRYSLLIDRLRDPFFQRTSWRIGKPIDLERARREAQYLIGTHDFAAFRSSKDHRPSTVKTISSVTIEQGFDPRLVYIDVKGESFLHNMVRIIVGTLVDVARGVLAEGAVQKALDSGNRQHLGITAPPHGLCLQHVQLRDSVDLSNAWPAPVQPLASKSMSAGMPPSESVPSSRTPSSQKSNK